MINLPSATWFVNEDKIKGGLKHLVDEVNKIGLKFGIWFEPEMISLTASCMRSIRTGAYTFPADTAQL